MENFKRSNKKAKTTIKIRKPRPTAGKVLLIYKMETHRREYPLPCVAVFLGMAAGNCHSHPKTMSVPRTPPVDSKHSMKKTRAFDLENNV